VLRPCDVESGSLKAPGYCRGGYLVATVKRGREKLHYLNPVPIGEIANSGIRKFEHRKIDALIEAVSQGWPSLMSSLKSLLETGQPLAETTKWPEDM
jgi:hypothetical protein